MRDNRTNRLAKELLGLLWIIHRKPVFVRKRLDELLEVTVKVVEKKKTYLWLEQEVRRADGEVCVAARIQAACVRQADMWPQALPAAIRDALSKGIPA